TPHLAAWAKTLIDGSLTAAGTSAAQVGLEKLGNVGVLYHGLELMGGGAILTGLILGAIGVFIIERQFAQAAAFALAGAVLTYFGLMHGESIGIGGGLGVTPSLVVAYALTALFLFGFSRSTFSAADEVSSVMHKLEPAE
ncbi:MAG: regulator, partial [Microvirga sp.]